MEAPHPWGCGTLPDAEATMRDESGWEGVRKRNEDPETVTGAVTGAAGAGAAAGAGLLVAGPLGGIIGALAGALGGWWAGREVVDAVQEVDREENRFRRAHEHAGATRPYEEARHAYRLGYVAARNPDNANRGFEEVEPALRDAWVQAHLHDRSPVPWEQVRAEVRSGFDVARERE